MSPGHRKPDEPGRDGSKPRRRGKDKPPRSDAKGQRGGTGTPPPGSVLPGQDTGHQKAASKAASGGTVLPGGHQASSGSRQTRKQVRQQQEAQKRRERQRWLLTGLAVLVVVALVIVAIVWLSGRDDDDSSTSGTERTEQTLTMTLAAEGSAATSGALMIDDPANASAASVLVPSRLFVEGPTPDGIPFGDTVLLGNDAAPGTALADTLDVIVDNTWQVSDAMLAALVEDVGGVLVDVDVDVVKDDKVVLAAGDGQLLTGDQAVLYANYLGNGEVEEARLARFGNVVDQLMRRLPDNHDTLVDVFTKVNATEHATLSVDDLADFAQSYGTISRGGDAVYQTLPTTVLASTGKLPALTVEAEGLERLRTGLLADSLPPDAGGDQITVLVQNGVGTPGLVEDKAATKLRDDGYEFLNGGNANEFGLKETVVLVPDSSEASIALGESVASTLGVPKSAVQVSELGQSVADVVVVLGEDFEP